MCRYAVSRKMFFNLVKDLFKLNEEQSRSVCILVGFGTKGIFYLCSLRKKYLYRCQILPISKSLYAISRKVIFNLARNLFNWNEGYNRNVCILVGFETKRIFHLVCLRKKYSFRCQTLRSKNCPYAVSRKVFFNLVKDLFKLNEG